MMRVAEFPRMEKEGVYNDIPKFSQSGYKLEDLEHELYKLMKKILLGLLLIALAISGGACPNGGCQGTCGCADQGSFPVNCPVNIDVPCDIAPPACATPNIPVPTVCPPPVYIPDINIPDVKVCTLTPPPVVAPPTICGPNVIIPVVKPPVIPTPQLPPQVPTTPPTRPLPPVITPPPAPGVLCDQDDFSRVFTLSFQYAARAGVALVSCEANVLWNDVIVYSIVPTDYDVHTYTINLTAIVGQNSLQFEGAGVSDSYGLGIDNVRLVRVGQTQSIVINGGFETPSQNGGWNIQDNILGWAGLGIEVGWGKIYNSQWQSQIVELDGTINFEITQYFTFNSDFRQIANRPAQTNSFNGKTLEYTLEFDYAARYYGASGASTSQANILWNDFVVASIVSADFEVHHFSKKVQLKAGNNVLEFDGAGLSDTYGLQITNVKLASVYNKTNLIFNGDFSNNALGSKQWDYFDSGIPGWSAKKAEVGYCQSVYNPKWTCAQQFCIELDSDSNQRYIQTVTISQAYFSQLWVYIQSQAGTTVAQNNLACAVHGAQDRINDAVAKINGDISCAVKLTNNKFSQYLNMLYGVSNEQVKDLQEDEQVVLNQLDILSTAYLQTWGQSSEIDFTDDFFLNLTLKSWNGFITKIIGKVVYFVDCYGHEHKAQFAPKCSHFECQFPQPRIGDKIILSGVEHSCGRIYVKIATTCNC